MSVTGVLCLCVVEVFQKRGWSRKGSSRRASAAGLLRKQPGPWLGAQVSYEFHTSCATLLVAKPTGRTRQETSYGFKGQHVIVHELRIKKQSVDKCDSGGQISFFPVVTVMQGSRQTFMRILCQRSSCQRFFGYFWIVGGAFGPSSFA